MRALSIVHPPHILQNLVALFAFRGYHKSFRTAGSQRQGIIFTIGAPHEVNQNLRQQYNVISDGTPGQLSGQMYGFRCNVYSTALFHVGGPVYLILRTAFENNLQFKLMVPVAGKAPVCKGIEMVYKF